MDDFHNVGAKWTKDLAKVANRRALGEVRVQ